jgi:hypothetical protein
MTISRRTLFASGAALAAAPALVRATTFHGSSSLSVVGELETTLIDACRAG